jgi:hypothetical protein
MPEINTSNLKLAQQSITEFANSRKLVFNRELDLANAKFNFTSKSQKKAFQHSLSRVIAKPTMKSISLFLRQLSKYSDLAPIKLDYSEREKAIKQAKKDWKFLQSKAEEARLQYKKVKGDFYKN